MGSSSWKNILKAVVVLGLILSRFGVTKTSFGPCTTEAQARKFIADLSNRLEKLSNANAEANWAYVTNITEANEKFRNEESTVFGIEIEKITNEVQKCEWWKFQDTDLVRRFARISGKGFAVLPKREYEELVDVKSQMQSNYAKAKVCSYRKPSNCSLSLEPDVAEIFRKCRDPKELEHYWLQWYNTAGTPVKTLFLKYVELTTKASQMNGLNSTADSWIGAYEDQTFEDQLARIVHAVRPFYLQLHGYVRYRLRQHYGRYVVPEKGPIPMHLLGNIWAQTWAEIADIVTPFPKKPIIDVTNEMVRQGYTPVKLFRMGDEFFQSLNMTKLPESFYKKSVLEKPTDGREMECHASAWDFVKKGDVRIKQCTRVTQEHLYVAHHELGHIQYYLQYQDQQFMYRSAGNPGFHEAVGDVISLSVSTPKHLQKIGLLNGFKLDRETRINLLFLKALDKLPSIPFAYTMDLYRWRIFRNETRRDQLNCRFWQLREDYVGIAPPVRRTERDFDATAKYHISADVEYARYLVSNIVQFQFYKAACLKAGDYKPGDDNYPLDNCDIYGSSEAGNAFKKMLSMGSAKPWPDAMEAFTGGRKMSAKAFLEYFEPLRVWLIAENKKHNVHIGWNRTKYC